MTDNSVIPVTVDPGSDDNLSGLLKTALRQYALTTDDLLPARIISYDRAANRATVQPLIRMLDSDYNEISRATHSNVPVLMLGAGNFFISFDIKPGSIGWIKASDRDLSLFHQDNNGESPPNTLRTHSFEDAIFIPDIMTGYTIADEDQDSMVIQDKQGAVKISLNSNRIKITAPTLTIEAGETNINTGHLNVRETVKIQGELSVTGNIDSDGNLSARGTISDGNTNLSTHIHTTPQGPTGPPQ